MQNNKRSTKFIFLQYLQTSQKLIKLLSKIETNKENVSEKTVASKNAAVFENCLYTKLVLKTLS